jgi:hypothetical protein
MKKQFGIQGLFPEIKSTRFVLIVDQTYLILFLGGIPDIGLTPRS